MKEIVLLVHVSENNDEKLLGLFCVEELENVIQFYNSLSGFSNPNGKYIKSLAIKTDKNDLWLLQIWDTDIEYVFLEKIFESRDNLNNYLNSIEIPNNLEVTIEKYSVGTKYWTSGYVSI